MVRPLMRLTEFAPAGAKKSNLFLAAACTSSKTLLGPQTCEQTATSGLRVRCGGPRPSRQSGKPLWRNFKRTHHSASSRCFCGSLLLQIYFAYSTTLVSSSTWTLI